MDRSKLQLIALRTRGDILDDDFERLGDMRHIDRAIDYRRWAVLLTPNEDPSKPEQLHSLAASYVLRYKRFRELTDIDKAMTYQSQAVELITESRLAKAGCLNSLANLYTYRFERLRAPSDIDKAIAFQVQAVGLIPESHPMQPACLGNLGDFYCGRFRLLQDISDLDKAISCHTRAVECIPDDDVDKPLWLINLGKSCQSRFKRLGELSDIDKAIACHINAVRLTPGDHAHKPYWLRELGDSYLARFERRGELPDIDKAITCHTQAVELSPAGHAEKLGWLDNIGSSYMSRFGRLGELSDVNMAIAWFTQAMEHTPEGHADKPASLSNLGTSYMRRFERLGVPSDIIKAITYQTQALELTHNTDERWPLLLNNLGMSHHARFKSLGEVLHIDKAVACHTEVLQLIPEGHEKRPGSLGNLGDSYHSRFMRLGEILDLEKAIAYQAQAVELTSDNHESKPGWLSNLGNSHQARFERLGELLDIENAIACHTRAVKLTPEGHPEKPAGINNIGNSCQRRFERYGELADNEKSIAYYARAVELTPDGHVKKPAWIQNLGIAYLARFERLGKLSDLDNAIAFVDQAVKLTPEGHADKPWWLFNLGSSYISRFKQFGGHSDAESASTFLQLAAQSPISKPDIQFLCARLWARCSSWHGASPKVAYQTAMELVPRLVWLGATIERRYDLLVEIGDIAIEAAAWAISVESYDLALEWLEEGRSIVWNQILQLRTTYDDLSAVDPALAQSLERTARELEYASSQTTTLSPSGNAALDLEQGAQRHRQLAADWERLLAKARSIDDFHNFMRPRNINELKLAAKNGHVVLINIHSSRCDALVIQPNNMGVAHISLPHFSKDRAKGTSAQLAALLGRQGTRSRGFKPAPYQIELRKILAMLWSDVVKPILGFLGYIRKPPVQELPHITWCTTGELSFLPLHAAGCYDGLQPNAPDLIVSSYTPTLGALLTSTAQSISSHSGLLAMGQQFSKVHGDLPSITDELDAISQHADAACFQKLAGSDATTEAVLNAMDRHGWVHLACHASQHPASPAHSAFHLNDGDLMLEAITKRSFKNKGLAFLSACQTAAEDEKRPDESIHLAAGMMMAGYPSVIATMWSIYDVDGPEVAGKVYAELLSYGKMDCTGAARALHKAVAGLREKVGEESFKRWVPFIHIGVSV